MIIILPIAVSAMATSLFCFTFGLAIFAVSKGVYKYLPVHIAYLFIQAGIAGFMIYLAMHVGALT
jgi:hypothetical protein